MVKAGMAIIIPTIPKVIPLIKVIRKISNGCEFTLFDEIMG
jgi:hypothetical protein